MKKVLFIFLSFITVHSIQAQSFAWGLKGGMTVGTQKWDNRSRDPLIKYHGIAFRGLNHRLWYAEYLFLSFE